MTGERSAQLLNLLARDHCGTGSGVGIGVAHKVSSLAAWKSSRSHVVCWWWWGGGGGGGRHDESLTKPPHCQSVMVSSSDSPPPPEKNPNPFPRMPTSCLLIPTHPLLFTFTPLLKHTPLSLVPAI